MRRDEALSLLLLTATLPALAGTARGAAVVNRCLDLTNGTNKCRVDDFFGIMDLSSCGITDEDVEAGDLAACVDAVGARNIPFLLLGSNNLRTLPLGMFDSLTELRALSLHQNQLTSLPMGIFDELTGLEYLYLDGNELKSLPSAIFDALTR
eukprot:g7301.t1